MPVRSTEWEGVYADGPWLLTRNLVPGAVVYGEGLVREKGREFRRWDANRSKLAAYLKRGGRVWPFRFRSSVLYLGAGSGTTASHVSDVCAPPPTVFDSTKRTLPDAGIEVIDFRNLKPFQADHGAVVVQKP